MNGYLEFGDHRIRFIGWFLKIFLPKWVSGITLAPFGIYIKESIYYWNVERFNEIADHERIHWQQQIGLYIVALIISTITQLILLFKDIFAWWFIPFVLFPFLFWYLVYGIEYLVKRIKYKGQAYKNISFERAAYAGDKGKYTWIKYL